MITPLSGRPELADAAPMSSAPSVQPAQPVLCEYPGTELEATAHARNYTRWVMAGIQPYLRGRVAEVGAGIGTISKVLLEAPIERLVAIEPAPTLFRELTRSFAGHERVELHHTTLPAVAPRFEAALDAIVYINVLEHIADDESELLSAAAALRPGGHLCLFVPAQPWLYSSLDAAMGHHRRYSRSGLVRTVTAAGLEVVAARHFDALGALTWLVAFKWLRMTMAPGSVRAYDRVVVPVARRLDGWIRNSFGKSLILVARRPRGA